MRALRPTPDVTASISARFAPVWRHLRGSLGGAVGYTLLQQACYFATAALVSHGFGAEGFGAYGQALALAVVLAQAGTARLDLAAQLQADEARSRALARLAVALAAGLGLLLTLAALAAWAFAGAPAWTACGVAALAPMAWVLTGAGRAVREGQVVRAAAWRALPPLLALALQVPAWALDSLALALASLPLGAALAALAVGRAAWPAGVDGPAAAGGVGARPVPPAGAAAARAPSPGAALSAPSAGAIRPAPSNGATPSAPSGGAAQSASSDGAERRPALGWRALWRSQHGFVRAELPAYLLNALSLQGQVLLVGVLAGDADAGRYALAQRIAFAPMSLFGPALTDWLRARLIGAAADQATRRRVGRALGWMATLSLAAHGVLALAMPWLVAVAFASYGAELVGVATVLLLAGAVRLVVSPLTFVLTLRGRYGRNLLGQTALAAVATLATLLGLTVGGSLASAAWLYAIGAVAVYAVYLRWSWRSLAT